MLTEATDFSSAGYDELNVVNASSDPGVAPAPGATSPWRDSRAAVYCRARNENEKETSPMNLGNKGIVLIVLVLTAATATSSIAQGIEVSGKWSCSGTGFGEEELLFGLDLKQIGTQVTGTVITDQGEIPIESGLIEAERMELVTAADGIRYTSKVMVQDDRLSATWSDTTGRSGTWKGTRAK